MIIVNFDIRQIKFFILLYDLQKSRDKLLYYKKFLQSKILVNKKPLTHITDFLIKNGLTVGTLRYEHTDNIILEMKDDVT